VTNHQTNLPKNQPRQTKKRKKYEKNKNTHTRNSLVHNHTHPTHKPLIHRKQPTHNPTHHTNDATQSDTRMKTSTKNWITNQVTQILDKAMLKEFPNLNTYKIATFYTNALDWTLNLTSTIILVLTFSWYFPTQYHMTQQTAIVILLCLLLIETGKKNNI
jgi:hypothetical protein